MWNPDDVLASLASVSPEHPPVPGSPLRDARRSPAAIRTNDRAHESGLFLFHFEHRYALDLPDSWLDDDQLEHAAPPTWSDGVLAERKYQSFRHDLMVGSFHPGHRGKWTTHELCHGLVGYAWNASASPFFHATAGRLAELLPVVLYYFLDEIGLTRCEDHHGPLYRGFCGTCERLASVRPLKDTDREFALSASQFLDAELAAIARSRRLGRPLSHTHATLNLCSDGLAYAEAHRRRLESKGFARFADLFLPADGAHSTLDELEARVVEVANHLALGTPCRPYSGRDAWVRQDLGFRMLTVWEQTADETADAVLSLAERVANGEAISAVRSAWSELCEQVVLPPAESLFGLGFPEEVDADLGRCWPQVLDGLRSVSPLVCELAQDASMSLQSVPLAWQREPLGTRWLDGLRKAHPGVVPLAELEVALRSPRADPLVNQLGPNGEGVQWADGTRVVRGDRDLLALAEAVDAGSVEGEVVEGRLVLPNAPPNPWALVVGRVGGELVMVEVDPADADDVDRGVVTDATEQLVELGVARPQRW